MQKQVILKSLKISFWKSSNEKISSKFFNWDEKFSTKFSGGFLAF